MRERKRSRPHRRAAKAPVLCGFCGHEVFPSFRFDFELDGQMEAVHPTCMAYTLGTEGVPPREIRMGQEIIQTCGDPMCVNPRHLEAVG